MMHLGISRDTYVYVDGIKQKNYEIIVVTYAIIIS